MIDANHMTYVKSSNPFASYSQATTDANAYHYVDPDKRIIQPTAIAQETDDSDNLYIIHKPDSNALCSYKALRQSYLHFKKQCPLITIDLQNPGDLKEFYIDPKDVKQVLQNDVLKHGCQTWFDFSRYFYDNMSNEFQLEESEQRYRDFDYNMTNFDKGLIEPIDQESGNVYMGSILNQMTSYSLEEMFNVQADRSQLYKQPFTEKFLRQKLFWPQIQAVHLGFEIRDNPDSQFLIQLTSPTGTGKTEQFILLQSLTSKHEHVDLCLTNSEMNAQQLYERHCKSGDLIKRSVSYVNISCDAATNELLMTVKTRQSMLYQYKCTAPDKSSKDAILQVFNERTYVINMTRSKLQYLDSHAKVNSRRQLRIDWDNSEILSKKGKVLNSVFKTKGVFGDVIIACTHNLQSLFNYGVLSVQTPVNSVTFDEVDVYYSLDTLSEFHELFFKYNNIACCRYLIMCSATLNDKFIDFNDNMISAKRISIQLDHMSNPQSIDTSSSYHKLSDDKVRIYKDGAGQNAVKFVRLSTVGYDDTTKTNIDFGNQLQVQFMHNVMSQVYIYFPCNYADGKFEYVKYQQLNSNVGNIQYHWLYRKSNKVRKELKLSDFVTSILEHKQFAVLSDQKLHFINTPIRQSLDVNLLESFKPLISTDIAFQQYSEHYIDSLKQNIERLFMQAGSRRTLLLHFGDPISRKLVEMTSTAKHNIFFVLDESSARYNFLRINNKLQSNKHNWYNKQLFVEQFQEQLAASNSHDWNKIFDHEDTKLTRKILVDTVERSGRGLDIPNLQHVIILIPLYVDVKQFNITTAWIKQAMGRVARGGKTGKCTLLFTGDFLGQAQAINFVHHQHKSRFGGDDYSTVGYDNFIRDYQQELFEQLPETSIQFLLDESSYQDNLVKRILQNTDPSIYIQNYTLFTNYLNQILNYVNTECALFLHPSNNNSKDLYSETFYQQQFTQVEHTNRQIYTKFLSVIENQILMHFNDIVRDYLNDYNTDEIIQNILIFEQNREYLQKLQHLIQDIPSERKSDDYNHAVIDILKYMIGVNIAIPLILNRYNHLKIQHSYLLEYAAISINGNRSAVSNAFAYLDSLLLPGTISPNSHKDITHLFKDPSEESKHSSEKYKPPSDKSKHSSKRSVHIFADSKHSSEESKHSSEKYKPPSERSKHSSEKSKRSPEMSVKSKHSPEKPKHLFDVFKHILSANVLKQPPEDKFKRSPEEKSKRSPEEKSVHRLSDSKDSSEESKRQSKRSLKRFDSISVDSKHSAEKSKNIPETTPISIQTNKPQKSRMDDFYNYMEEYKDNYSKENLEKIAYDLELEEDNGFLDDLKLMEQIDLFQGEDASEAKKNTFAYILGFLIFGYEDYSEPEEKLINELKNKYDESKNYIDSYINDFYKYIEECLPKQGTVSKMKDLNETLNYFAIDVRNVSKSPYFKAFSHAQKQKLKDHPWLRKAMNDMYMRIVADIILFAIEAPESLHHDIIDLFDYYQENPYRIRKNAKKAYETYIYEFDVDYGYPDDSIDASQSDDKDSKEQDDDYGGNGDSDGDSNGDQNDGDGDNEEEKPAFNQTQKNKPKQSGPIYVRKN